jgi:hypothetical protein
VQLVANFVVGTASPSGRGPEPLGLASKLGLTRRLEPLDRVKELGEASVPFEFDIHAMIKADDAPALENRLHKHFVLNQVNKVNHRKEFFRADIADLRREIEALGCQAAWTMAADAAQYRESLAIDRAIESDPAAREAWINRQLTLDPIGGRDLAMALTDDDREDSDNDE